MPNSVKTDGDHGAALQVTKYARAADLVEENQKGEATRLAPVRIHAFDSLLLLTDRERVGDPDLVELQLAAIRDVGPIRHVGDATVTIAGNGYQVALPGAAEAGFEIGDTAIVHSAPNVLVITPDGQYQLARDLATTRQGQVAT